MGIKGKINPEQIYTILDRLIRDQLVSSPGMDDQERKYDSVPTSPAIFEWE